MKVILLIILAGVAVLLAALYTPGTGHMGLWIILGCFWGYLGFKLRAVPSLIRRLELKTNWFGAGKTQRLEREANAKLRERQRKEDEASQE